MCEIYIEGRAQGITLTTTGVVAGMCVKYIEGRVHGNADSSGCSESGTVAY
jgi:hypothetical protein